MIRSNKRSRAKTSAICERNIFFPSFMDKLRKHKDRIVQALQLFKSSGMPLIPRASVGTIGETIDMLLKFVYAGGNNNNPIPNANLVETIKVLRDNVESVKVDAENQANWAVLKNQLEASISEIEEDISESLVAYYKSQKKFSERAISSLGGRKGLIIGIVLLVSILLMGAGIPIVVYFLKNKNGNSGSTPAKNISVSLVPNMGFDVQPPSVGGSYTLNTNQISYAKSNNVCTYTSVLNIGDLESTDGTHVLLARTSSSNNDIDSAIMRLRLDTTVNNAFIDFKQTDGNYCTFTIEEVPMYRWFVLHIVYNNTTNYNIAQIYIDGGLVKLCHLFLCQQPLAPHDGDKFLFGQEYGGTGTSSSPMNIQNNYFKYASYTMQPDEIASEARSLTMQLNKQIKQQLKDLNACASS